MISTSLITIQNAIILWNLYHYYVYADSIYKGVYYTGKVLKTSKDIIEYVFIDKVQHNEIEIEIEENKDWLIIEP
jgi:hypothetical protein